LTKKRRGKKEKESEGKREEVGASLFLIAGNKGGLGV